MSQENEIMRKSDVTTDQKGIILPVEMRAAKSRAPRRRQAILIGIVAAELLLIMARNLPPFMPFEPSLRGTDDADLRRRPDQLFCHLME